MRIYSGPSPQQETLSVISGIGPSKVSGEVSYLKYNYFIIYNIKGRGSSSVFGVGMRG